MGESAAEVREGVIEQQTAGDVVAYVRYKLLELFQMIDTLRFDEDRYGKRRARVDALRYLADAEQVLGVFAGQQSFGDRTDLQDHADRVMEVCEGYETGTLRRWRESVRE